jgi:hypothetical protein
MLAEFKATYVKHEERLKHQIVDLQMELTELELKWVKRKRELQKEFDGRCIECEQQSKSTITKIMNELAKAKDVSVDKDLSAAL